VNTILLVEDDPSLIDVYSVTFTYENFAIIVAHDGQECLQKVKTIMPDLILMDIMMPEMNGIQALEKLKADTMTKNIPVLVLSNIAESAHETRALELGALQYLIKSQYLPMDIVNIVKNVLLKSHIGIQP
jgi:CheY-like chemotaxis protein